MQEGIEETFFVTSATGRCVASFEDRTLADEWLRERVGSGVTYRLFASTVDTVELER